MTLKAIATLVYGVWLIVAGALRFAEASSVAALGFGLAMGSLALAAAVLMFKDKRIWGYVLIGVTLVFVIGFFATKTFKEGFDLRVAVTLAASVLETIVVFKPQGAPKAGPPA